MAGKNVSKVVVNGSTIVDLTGVTVTPEALAKGYTAHGKDGALVVGTNSNDADTSGASAEASDILSGVTAYAKGKKLTGTIKNNGSVSATISTADGKVTVPAGYTSGGTVKLDESVSNLTPENVRKGVKILGVTGTSDTGLDLSKVTVTADKLAKGITAYDSSGVLITGTGDIKAPSTELDIGVDPTTFDTIITDTQIADKAYARNSTIKKVYLPNATYIGGGAFDGSSMTVLYAPKVKTIGGNKSANSIGNCDSLHLAYLPRLESASGYLFYDCDTPITAFIGIYYKGVVSLSYEAFFYGNESHKMYVADDYLSGYQSDKVWKSSDSVKIAAVSEWSV